MTILLRSVVVASGREVAGPTPGRSRKGGTARARDGAGRGQEAAVGPGGGDGAEVAGERVEVVMYAAAVDVAKGSGMGREWCAPGCRAAGPAAGGRRCGRWTRPAARWSR